MLPNTNLCRRVSHGLAFALSSRECGGCGTVGLSSLVVDDGTDLLEEWGRWGMVDGAVTGVVAVLHTVHPAPVATVVEQLVVTRVLWENIIVSWFDRVMNERMGNGDI